MNCGLLINSIWRAIEPLGSSILGRPEVIRLNILGIVIRVSFFFREILEMLSGISIRTRHILHPAQSVSL